LGCVSFKSSGFGANFEHFALESNGASVSKFFSTRLVRSAVALKNIAKIEPIDVFLHR
jgi:hypothetical protein